MGPKYQLHSFHFILHFYRHKVCHKIHVALLHFSSPNSLINRFLLLIRVWFNSTQNARENDGERGEEAILHKHPKEGDKLKGRKIGRME